MGGHQAGLTELLFSDSEGLRTLVSFSQCACLSLTQEHIYLQKHILEILRGFSSVAVCLDIYEDLCLVPSTQKQIKKLKDYIEK